MWVALGKLSIALAVKLTFPSSGWALSSGYGINGLNFSKIFIAPSIAFTPSQGRLLWACLPLTVTRISTRPLLPS